MLLVRHYMHQIRAEIKPTMNDLKSASQNIDPHHDIIYIAPDSGATAPPVKIAEIYDREEIEHIENDTPEMTGCLSIDHKARIQSFDANCERLFGFKRSEVINRNVSLLMPTAYALEHDAYLTRYLCGGEPRIIGCGCEISPSARMA